SSGRFSSYDLVRAIRMDCRALHFRRPVRARRAAIMSVVAWIIPAAALWAQSPQPVNELDYVLPASSLQTALEAGGAEAEAAALGSEELVARLLAAEERILALEAERSAPLTAPEEEVAEEPEQPEPPAEEPEKKWYDKYTVRGYAQFRINEVMDFGPNSAPAQVVGDRSVGDDQNFLIRRARLIFAGDISEHLYVYLQPDFAVQPPGSPDANHFAQIRDWYGDIYWDADKVNRFRVGQSKIPYGWENMQSSSNRIPLDRNDALNSAARNERDLGVFYYWTPQSAQEIFTWVNDTGLKGSGNYGIFGFGAYNGQGGSFQEQNDNLHVIARLTVPFFIHDCQLVEVSMQGYTGKYTVLSTPISPLGVGAPVRPAGTLEAGNRPGIRDERLAWTFVYYPQPLGFQSEWNIGRGPALNDAQTEVGERDLHGGYAMAFYRLQTACHGEFWPFVRYNYYRGGYKPERNAPYSFIDEWEAGVEWQFNKQVELTTGFTYTDRTNTTAQNAADTLSYGQFVGDLARVQLQINY
ncbi:MAG TPA: porin, partial [Lacipirellulaceae bacterium]|nr:porin [Lacipirellulaceae bacterium]